MKKRREAEEMGYLMPTAFLAAALGTGIGYLTRYLQEKGRIDELEARTKFAEGSVEVLQRMLKRKEKNGD